MAINEIALTGAAKALAKPLEDIYEFSKNRFSNNYKYITYKNKIRTFSKHISNVQKVKTIWQVDKEVNLKSFYYPSSIEIDEEKVNGEECYVLKQTPQYEFSGYSYQKVWIDKSHYRVQKIEFYDQKEALLKTLELSDYKLFKDKYWRPMKSFMRNVQTRKSTYLLTEEMSFNTELTDSDFDKNSLKRVR